MLYSTLMALHLIALVIWIGGMAFVHFFLRPAVASLEPPVGLTLMQAVLKRFFAAITYLSLLALFTGFWMMGSFAKAAVQAGAEFSAPLDWSVMAALGVLMVIIFGHIRFALFGRLSRAVAASDWAAAQAAMDKTRQWVLTNLVLGLFIVAFTLMV